MSEKNALRFGRFRRNEGYRRGSVCICGYGGFGFRGFIDLGFCCRCGCCVSPVVPGYGFGVDLGGDKGEDKESLVTLFESKAQDKIIKLSVNFEALDYNIISDPTRI